MKMLANCLFLLALALPLSLFSQDSQPVQVSLKGWDTITIPGAKCGDGSDYKVWYQKRDQKSLTIEIMGGGACWSQQTCFGVRQRTFFHSLPTPLPGLATTNNHKLPKNFQEGSTLYLGYCTGDVHLGDHHADYGFKNGFHHSGKKNFEQTFKYLFQQGIINPYTYENLLVTGSSAGAIGAIVNAPLLETLFPFTENKVLIADAPGLHFSDKFWKQFSAAFETDFKAAFTRLGLTFSNESGIIARHLPHLCQRFSNWKVGLLQGSKDMVMSALFGKLTPWEHHDRIASEVGMIAMAQRTQNCSIWVPDTFMHTFLIAPVDGARIDEVGPFDFINRVIESPTAISMHF
jgi:hypothetical protein